MSNSPLKWFGSKGRQLKRLRLALPESFDYLIEPFAGSAAFSLAMIEEGFIDSTKVWLNDMSPACMAFWSTLRDNPNFLRSELLDIYDRHGIGNKGLFIQAFDEIHKPNNGALNLAKAQYVVSRLGFGGKAACRGNYCNPFKTGHGLMSWKIQELRRFATLVQGTEQSCGDYRKVQPSSPNTLAYIDPPYGEDACNTPDSDSYGHSHTIDQSELLEYCESLRDKCNLLISYGDSPEAMDRFADWNIYRIPVIRSTRKEKSQTELVITNYEIPFSEMLDVEEWELAA